MTGATCFSGTMMRFSSYGRRDQLDPSAARMRDCCASGDGGELARQGVEDLDPAVGGLPVAPTAGITRPAPSRPSTIAVATKAPSRLSTLVKLCGASVHGHRVTAEAGLSRTEWRRRALARVDLREGLAALARRCAGWDAWAVAVTSPFGHRRTTRMGHVRPPRDCSIVVHARYGHKPRPAIGVRNRARRTDDDHRAGTHRRALWPRSQLGRGLGPAGALRRSDPDALFVQGAAQQTAKTVCQGCPVIAECLADALDNRTEFGVWGGMTERERRALLKRRPDIRSWANLLRPGPRRRQSEPERRRQRLTQVPAAPGVQGFRARRSW